MNDFFFKTETSFRLQQVCRIWCLLVIVRQLGLGPLWRSRQFLPVNTNFIERSYFLQEIQVPWGGLEWLPAPSFWGFACLDWLAVPLALLFAWGGWGRWPGLLLALLLSYRLALSQLLFQHHFYLLTLGVWVLALAPGSTGDPRILRWAWPRRWLQLLVSTIYLAAALSKCQPHWLSGQVLTHLDQTEKVQGVIGHFLLGTLPSSAVAVATVVWELSMALGLWNSAWRPWIFWLGVAGHLSFSLTMNVDTFGLQMITLYLLFRGEPVSAQEPEVSDD